MTRGRSTNEVFVATTGEQTALDVVAQSIATDWIDRPALARRAELRKVDDIRLEIARSRQTRREPDLAIDGAAAPERRPIKRWSELRETERTLAKWAGRGPEDYLPEPDVDPDRPAKPWHEMSENEHLRAALSELKGSGDLGRKMNRQHEPGLGRDTPGIDLPGL